MKLNKLTSAVSVSLLAVALTACGGSDNSGDEGPILTPTPAPSTTPAPTPSVTPTPTPAAGSTAAELTAALTAAGLTNANAAALIAANPGLTVGSAEYNTLLARKLAEQNAAANNTGTNTAVSPTVSKNNHHIKGVDTTKQPTVTANQYSRQDGSTFDRVANPSQAGGLGAVGTDDPTVTNPYLSNYVLGVEVVAGKVIAIDSTGELVKTGNNAGKVDADKSPYATRDGLVYTTDASSATRTYQYSTGLDSPTGGTQTDPVTAKFKAEANEGSSPYTRLTNTSNEFGKIWTIQDVNATTTKVIPEAAIAAEAAAGVTGRTAPSTGWGSGDDLLSGLVVYTKDSAVVGNVIGKAQNIKKPVFGIEENIYQYNRDGKLIAVNTAEAVSSSDAVTAQEVIQEVKDVAEAAANGNRWTNKPATYKELLASDTTKTLTSNNYETRVFGKNYKTTEVGKTGYQSYDNSYVGRYNNAEKLVRVATTTLHNTQYGRLTNNIDVLDTASSNKSNAIIYRQFQQHGADNTVDTYFYRGTNHTSFADMDKLKAAGGTYQYYGHALTYNIGPKVPKEATSTSLPTAYGLTSTDATIGNFVEAKFNAATSKVDGNIYNFLNEDVGTGSSKDKFVKQNLVSFGGDVYGNTVTGTATKLGITPEVGTFTGSFFGANAQELGGSISSITRSEGYNTPKWGAVFGATKGTAVENFNVIEQGNGN